MNRRYLIIIGAGAAGLFCAYLAAKRGITPLVLEAGKSAARKLSVSGGGYANFSNLQISDKNYLCHANPQFCTPIITQFSTKRFLHYIDTWKLPYEQRGHGRLFLKIKAANLAEILRQGLEIKYNTAIKEILPLKNGEWELYTTAGKFNCARLILALGSPAHPSLVPTGYTLNMLKALGHKINPLRPALAPLNWAENNNPEVIKFKSLAGIGLSCRLTLADKKGNEIKHWDDDILFTHQGLSGPAILQASLFREKGMKICIDFLPYVDFEKMLDSSQNSRSTARSILRRYLPARLIDAIIPAAIASIKIAELSRNYRRQLAKIIHVHYLPTLTSSGLKKAEVCAGGIDISQINNENMSSRIWPTLSMAGEMLDVTGELGGYNLHWAFASAWCATQGL